MKHVYNMRDIGGYVNKDNKEIKYNRFIRSNLPINLLDKEIDYLLENNIKTIIDLRSEKEVLSVKSSLNEHRFNYYNIDLNGNKIPKCEEDIPINYMDIIDNHQAIKKVLDIIINSKENILFNCQAGKDRTGVITMILMLIANLDDSDIIADYSVSYIYIRDEVRKKRELGIIPKYLGYSKYWYMEETLKLFYEKYHNIDNYLEIVGLTKEECLLIRKKLFE